MSVHAHRTEGVIRSEEREGVNGVGGGIRVGGRTRDRNVVGGGHLNDDGDGGGAGTRTGV